MEAVSLLLAGSLGWDVLLSSGAEAVPPSSPDCSDGIWTLRRGRFASDTDATLERGPLLVGVLDVRCGDLIDRRAGEGTPFALLWLAAAAAASFSRCIAAMSIDAERGPPSLLATGSDRGASAWLVEVQCCASMDLLSSTGVNIICAFACAGKGFGCGTGGLVNCCCGG